jgi:hypothetical protein
VYFLILTAKKLFKKGICKEEICNKSFVIQSNYDLIATVKPPEKNILLKISDLTHPFIIYRWRKFFFQIIYWFFWIKEKSSQNVCCGKFHCITSLLLITLSLKSAVTMQFMFANYPNLYLNRQWKPWNAQRMSCLWKIEPSSIIWIFQMMSSKFAKREQILNIIFFRYVLILLSHFLSLDLLMCHQLRVNTLYSRLNDLRMCQVVVLAFHYCKENGQLYLSTK